MLQVACQDIGVLGCDFVARGEKVRKVEDTMLHHILQTHPHLIAGLTPEQRKDLDRRIASRVRRPEEEGRPTRPRGRR